MPGPNKFWGNSSDSESDSDSNSSASEVSTKQKVKKWNVDSGSESDEDEQRIIKSAKQKTDEVYTKLSKGIRSSLNTLDFNTVLKHYTALINTKDTEKPLAYYHSIDLINTTVQNQTKEVTKKLSKTNGKSFNVLKSRLKKLFAQDTSLAERLENLSPEQDEAERASSSDDDSSEEDSSDAESESESDSSAEDAKKESAVVDEEDKGSESESGSDSAWESSSSDEESESSLDDDTKLTGRNKWVKRVPDTDAEKLARIALRKQKDSEKQERAKQRKLDKEQQIESKTAENQAVKDSEILSDEIITEKIDAILLLRGKQKKLSEFEDLIAQMRDIVSLIEENKEHISNTLYIQSVEWLIKLQFDVRVHLDEYMSIPLWDRIIVDIHKLISLAEYDLDLSLFVQRLNVEYNKSLRYIDNHSNEYIQRLKDEVKINELAEKLFGILEPEKATICALIILTNNYYKMNFADISKYFKFVIKYGTSEQKIKSIIFYGYNLCISNEFQVAKNLFLSSKIQDKIVSQDVETQIQFNRLIVQFGFCAFRHGDIKQAHNCLIEICQSGSKTKELLAQGIFWRRNFADNKALLMYQKEERRRLLPYHLHINLDVLEFYHLAAAMILENNSAKVVSKTFRRHLEKYEKQVFTGPPENVRDHILAAALCLREADWEKTVEYLVEPKILSKEVEVMLISIIKKQALRTYMYTYSSVYESIEIQYLSKKFQLEEKEVHMVISKMIIEEDLKASWDQVNGCVKMHRSDPTHLQALGLQFADKLSSLVDANEARIGSAM